MKNSLQILVKVSKFQVASGGEDKKKAPNPTEGAGIEASKP
ncbi:MULTISPECIES: hypothetical protein [Paenibacillus]|nr:MULTISPECIES: hypothetical protein [Paenibacillus]RED40926.1 hypothetical protein C7820_2094 [Paenibacillus sp. VMFN-D1]